jgi:hypothetical protein
MKLHPCPECESRDVFKTKGQVSAGGGEGPPLLTGLGPWYAPAKMMVVVCRSCGLIRAYASEEARKKLGESSKWTRA